MCSKEKNHFLNFGTPVRSNKTKMSQSIDMKGQQVKKERVDVAETLKQNPTRKRLWRKPKNPTENDGNTQLGDHINCPTEGIFRLHPLENPEVKGQFKTSAHETPGPSRIPPVPGHSCVGSTDIETSVWTKAEESIRQTLFEGRGYPKGIFRLTPIVRGLYIPKERDQPLFNGHEKLDDATLGPSAISDQSWTDDIDDFNYELDLTKDVHSHVDLTNVIARNSKKRKREEDEGDEELKPERKRARRTGSWLPSKKRKREEDEDDEMCKPPPKRARHTGGWMM